MHKGFLSIMRVGGRGVESSVGPNILRTVELYVAGGWDFQQGREGGEEGQRGKIPEGIFELCDIEFRRETKSLKEEIEKAEKRAWKQ